MKPTTLSSMNDHYIKRAFNLLREIKKDNDKASEFIDEYDRFLVDINCEVENEDH